MDEEITIRLNRDQALVLSDWLDRVIGSSTFDAIVDQDRAVWSPLHRVAGTLDTSLVEIFAPDYSVRLDAAETGSWIRSAPTTDRWQGCAGEADRRQRSRSGPAAAWRGGRSPRTGEERPSAPATDRAGDEGPEELAEVQTGGLHGEREQGSLRHPR